MKKTRVLYQRAGGLLAVAAAALLTCGSAWSQLSVGPSGLPTQTFDTLPTPVQGWSTLGYSTGGAGTLDADVNANTDATAVTTTLGSSTTFPPSQSTVARWNGSTTDPNAGRHFLQTRPTTSTYLVLMATLQNDSESAQNQIVISYDWAQHNPIPVSEDVYGQRVFYSLTGAPNSWTLLPDLSNFNENSVAESLSTTIVFPEPWAAGSRLYIIWADDNGPRGTDNPQEGSYSIDNFGVTFSVQPPAIVTQPASSTNAEYSVVTLNVSASGSGPFTYQWTKDGNPLPGATSSSLRLTNMTGSGFTWSRPEDSGDYAVTVSGAVAPPAASDPAHVVITPDTNAPTFFWALSDTNAAGNLVIRVAYSEPLITALSDLTEPIFWNVLKVSGPGADLLSPDEASAPVILTNVVFATTNTLEIHLVFALGVALDPATTYKVTFDGGAAPLVDRAQTPNTMANYELPLYAHSREPISLNSEWRYSGLDVPPPGNWWEAAYDDSDGGFWTLGNGPFDAFRDGCRTDTLHNLGPVGTCLVWSNDLAPAVITNYYFRTHFNYPGQPQANGMMILNGKFDDGGVIYLNGQEIVRLGMPAGPLEHTNYANRTVGGTDLQDTFYLFPGSALKSGDNVVAVRLAQVNLSSSDATMGLRMVISTIDPLGPAVTQPQLTITNNGTQISVRWTPPGGSLLEATSVTGPFTTNAAASNPHVFTLPTGSGQRFFRVAQ
ncbi:MAG TPA: immunoglobulin domain-containing protein, partial [Candidatus Acidoferrum sp.]|nr:immunoglobulin domain-containing protein [Candidatus Acidoferrum sp.]